MMSLGSRSFPEPRHHPGFQVESRTIYCKKIIEIIVVNRTAALALHCTAHLLLPHCHYQTGPIVKVASLGTIGNYICNAVLGGEIVTFQQIRKVWLINFCKKQERRKKGTEAMKQETMKQETNKQGHTRKHNKQENSINEHK